MADISVLDGSWMFDGEIVRIAPGGDKNVHEIRKTLGELVIPREAISAVAFEPSRKGGHLRLRLRSGADPLTDVVGGGLSAPADPYRLAVPKDRTGAAEHFVDEVRDSLLIWETPSGPCDGFLLPGPAVPVTASAGDGAVSFDGDRVHLEWTLFAKSVKDAAGPQTFPLSALAGVEWKPLTGVGYGSLRFRLKGAGHVGAPTDDPHCLSWGMQRYGGTTALVAAAVLARLPRHPEEPAPPAVLDRHDMLVRRLSDLGELHRTGVLTDEEFSGAKQSLLRHLGEP